MCGIAGIIGPRSESARLAAVRTMAGALRHRGPDDEGLWVPSDRPVALGHRRLSIIDLSAAGHQPMTSRDGRWTVSYNGEIYNHGDLRRTLQQRNHRFRGHSDTEVLVESIAQMGLRETLIRLNGMFGIAAWDDRERVVHLVRDGVGEKPLYYSTLRDRSVAFASELKALTAVDGYDATEDARSVGTYFRLGYIPSPWSIHRSTAKVRPGEIVTIDASGSFSTDQWWSMPAVDADHSATAEEVDELLVDAVRLRHESSDVPVGVFLSSGLDSSLVAALAAESHDTPIRTFTMGFDDPSVDESDDAARIAGAIGADHTTLRVRPDEGLDLATSIPAIYDEPFADPSAIPTLLLCRHASEHVKVALSGDGGDEFFGGYNRYSLGSEIWPRLALVPLPIRRLGAAVASRMPPSTMDRLASSSRWPDRLRVRNAGAKLERLATLLRSEEGRLPKRLMSLWPDDLPTSDRAEQVTPLDGDALESVSMTDRMMYLDSVTTLPDQMLTKVDRASMASSLEVRAPLLDPRLASIAVRLPAELRTTGGQTKIVLQKSLARRLSTELLDRPKIGFDPPLGKWLRGPLRPWALDLLESPAAPLDRSVLAKTWAAFDGGRPLDYQVWSILMYLQWNAR